MNHEIVSLPIGWILTAIGTLAGTIATLAAVMWGFMKSRLSAQDRIIDLQGSIITKLQEDVKRMAAGCGIDTCTWKFR